MSDFKDSDLKRLLIYAGSGVITVLFAGNIYFVSRLVYRIESMVDEVYNLRQQVTLLGYRMDELQKRSK